MSLQILIETIYALFPTSELIRSSDSLVEIRHFGHNGMWGFITYSTDELITLFNQKCLAAKKDSTLV